MRKGRFAQRSAGGIRLRSHRSAGDQARGDAGQHSQRRLPALRQAHRRRPARGYAAGQPVRPWYRRAGDLSAHPPHGQLQPAGGDVQRAVRAGNQRVAIANIFSRTHAPFAAEAGRIDAEVRAQPRLPRTRLRREVKAETCWQWVFGSATAVAHRIAASRGKAVVSEFLKDATPEVTFSRQRLPELVSVSRRAVGATACHRHRAPVRSEHELVLRVLAPDSRMVDGVARLAPAPLRGRVAACGAAPRAGSGAGLAAPARVVPTLNVRGDRIQWRTSATNRSKDRADLPLERRDVRREDVPRPFRLAGGDREQHVLVLVDAREQVREPVDHQVPDPQRQVEIAPERLLEERVGGAAVDEPVHARVELHQRLEVVGAAALMELLEQPAELLALGVGDPLRRPIRRVAFELGPHVGDMGEIRDVDVRGERAAPREHRDQVLEREPLDRLPHGGAAHLELAADQVLVDRSARRDSQRDEPVPQLAVGAVGEQTARRTAASAGDD